MKSVISKLKNINKASKQQLIELDPNTRLIDLFNKTIIGFLAKEIGKEMNLSTEAAHVLYYSAISSGEEFSNNDGLFFDYAYKIVDWCERHKDVEAEINSLDASELMKQALITVYHKHKYDLNHLTVINKPNYEENQEWQIYREAMYAASQEKFLLISKQELDECYNGEILAAQTILDRQDIPICRQKTTQALESLQVNQTELRSWLLVVSEAVTNVLKHADSGSMVIINGEDEVRIIVKDNGRGYPIKELPNLILLSGFSTKQSLGQGFTLMMKIVDLISLYTDHNGSSIVLTKRLNKNG
ncbi:ATP-binding protein [Alkalibacillus silvisoli]|uniref:Histidine kinase/HSP90-like ATPase domain-containing protein n=1 Tax=Alkalibacillus silvisoli TaxID=392823 RepID=A0ABP3JV85_9BACI